MSLNEGGHVFCHTHLIPPRGGSVQAGSVGVAVSHASARGRACDRRTVQADGDEDGSSVCSGKYNVIAALPTTRSDMLRQLPTRGACGTHPAANNRVQESAKVGHRAGRTGSSTKCHDGVPPWKDGSPASLHREVAQGRKHCAYSSLSSRGEGRRNCTILSAYAKQRQRKTSYKQKAGKRAPAGTLLTKALGRNNPAMEAALRRRLRLPLPLQLLRPQPRGDHALACGGCWLAERKSWSGPGCA